VPRLAASPARVVATLRDEDAEPGSAVRTVLEAVRRRGLVEFVRLGGLAAAETRELVADLAGYSIPADLVKKVADGSEGSPFFVEEILRHYRSDAALRGQQDTAAVSGAGAFARRRGAGRVGDEELARGMTDHVLGRFGPPPSDATPQG